jgi:hypothetical protein
MSLLQLGALELVLMAVGMLVVCEVCYRFGLRSRDELRGAKRSQTDLAVTALLTILGLLLAFSFDLAASQFVKRRDLVVEDGNAITTAYLRADLLPAPHDERVRELLREYVAKRASVRTFKELEGALRESATLHAELWSETTAAARERYDSPVVARFIDSLNKVIDLQESEINASYYQRLPRAIFWVLYFVSFVSIGLFGLRGGLDRSRNLLSATVLTVVIITVIGLVDSLDNPQSRVFEVSQHAIHDTQQAMTSAPQPGGSAMQP